MPGPTLILLARATRRFDELVVGAALDEQARARRTGLPSVLEDGVGRSCRGEVEVGVGKDDVRRLAAELHHDRNDVLGGKLGDVHADLNRSGERQLIDIGMTRQSDPSLGASSGNDVDDARRQPAREADFAET